MQLKNKIKTLGTLIVSSDIKKFLISSSVSSNSKSKEYSLEVQNKLSGVAKKLSSRVGVCGELNLYDVMDSKAIQKAIDFHERKIEFEEFKSRRILRNY